MEIGAGKALTAGGFGFAAVGARITGFVGACVTSFPSAPITPAGIKCEKPFERCEGLMIPSLYSRRQRNTRLALRSCRRATIDTDEPGFWHCSTT